MTGRAHRHAQLCTSSGPTEPKHEDFVCATVPDFVPSIFGTPSTLLLHTQLERGHCDQVVAGLYLIASATNN